MVHRESITTQHVSLRAKDKGSFFFSSPSLSPPLPHPSIHPSLSPPLPHPSIHPSLSPPLPHPPGGPTPLLTNWVMIKMTPYPHPTPPLPHPSPLSSQRRGGKGGG